GYTSGSDTLFRHVEASGQRTTWNYNSTVSGPLLAWFSPVVTIGANGSAGRQLRVSGCTITKDASTVTGCSATSAPSVQRPIDDRSLGGFASLRIGLFDQVYATTGLRVERNPRYGSAHKLDWTPTY